MPQDQVEGRSRYVGSVRHDHNFGGGWTSNLNVNGVSDPRYFIDLSTRLALTSCSTCCARLGDLRRRGWWTATGMLQAFQTLDDPKTGAAPVSIPTSACPS